MAKHVATILMAAFWLVGGWEAIKLAKEFDTKQTDNKICQWWFSPVIFATLWLSAIALDLAMTAVEREQ